MKKLSLLTLLLALAVGAANATQIIRITNLQQGKRFDGIGAVNGGGATSVLLKDYPEPQRSVRSQRQCHACGSAWRREQHSRVYALS